MASPLFERRGTGLVPTSEALSLYAEVERAFVGLERIEQMATELRTPPRGLSAHRGPAGAGQRIPAALPGEFLKERPKLDIVLSGLVSHAVLASVAQGQSDLGFAEASMEHVNVDRERMPPAPFVAVLPSSAIGWRARSFLRPADFEGENFISLGPSTLSRFRIDRVFAEHGVDAHPAHRDALVGDRLCAGGRRRRRGAVRALHRHRVFDARHRGAPLRAADRLRVRRPACRRNAACRRWRAKFIDGFSAHVARFLRRGPWR